MNYGYDNTGARIAPYTEAQRQAEMARIRAADEERERNRRAWNRLCGSLEPIGHAVDL